MSTSPPVHVCADVTIPLRPPSLNDWHKKHWSVYHAIKKTWAKALDVFLRSPAKAATRPRIIEVQRSVGPRERSYDGTNAVGGMKPIEDMLVMRGWIRGDTPRDVRVLHAPDHQGRKTPELRIIIRDPWPGEFEAIPHEYLLRFPGRRVL